MIHDRGQRVTFGFFKVLIVFFFILFSLAHDSSTCKALLPISEEE